MKTLIIIPPFTQPNTAYPSAAQLSGFLNSKGFETVSCDLSVKVIHKIFSKEGLRQIFNEIKKLKINNFGVQRILNLEKEYLNSVEPVIRFMQGKDPNLAYSIVQEGFIPHGEAFERLTHENDAFGVFGVQDKAKYYSSLFLEDLINLIKNTISPNFGFSRYAEQIAISQSSFEPVLEQLENSNTIIDKFIVEETEKIINEEKPGLVAFSIPFPGNLLGALVSANYIKSKYKNIKIAFGGGYINTELRKLNEPKIFDLVDFITLDDGEMPLLNILQNLTTRNEFEWVRTFVYSGDNILFLDNGEEKEIEHNNLPAPDLRGIEPSDYLSITEVLNPMHRLWSDGYWNKITLAHGCYWHQCTFCDTSLDYIERYRPAKAEKIADWMESLIAQSGRSSFHFTDEAAPPAALKELAIEILKRGLKISWWGNIRFEKAFTADLCRLLATSGCVGVSGGLEAAEDRLLGLIQKGVTIEQASNVFRNFREAGILVHSYLMYGFPTQNEQELINSLETVRQFIANDLFQSGYWHRFTLTCHSPVAKEPEKFNIKIKSPIDHKFANNDLEFEDLSGTDFSKYSEGLKKSLYNYMHGIGLDWKLQDWFEFPVCEPGVPEDLISKYLEERKPALPDKNSRILWLGTVPRLVPKNKKNSELSVNTGALAGEWVLRSDFAEWLEQMLIKASDYSQKLYWKDIEPDFPGDINRFMLTKVWNELREAGLVIV